MGTTTYKGASLLQEGLPVSNFICSDADGLIFNPSDPVENVTAEAYITHHPLDTLNPLWNSVEIEWNRIASVTPTDFDARFSLYGITPMNDVVLVGEKVITNCPTSNVSEKLVFDLLQSACEPPLTKDSAISTSGKIGLNLPLTYKNFEEIDLYPQLPGNGNTRYKAIPITGSVDNNQTNFPLLPIYIGYDADMNIDFSDIRFYVWNGSSFSSIPFQFIRVVNGVSASVSVQVPSLPQSPTITYLYMSYGNPILASGSTSPNNLFYIDDFEDGLLIGRAAPYANWTVSVGTGLITNTTPISGNYSLRHTGNGSSTLSNRIFFPETSTQFEVSFVFKLLTQGVGTYTPYIWLFLIDFVDITNYTVLETFYDGTYQVMRIRHVVSGTSTYYGTYNFLTGKLPVGTNVRITIRQMNNGWLLYVNGVQRMSIGAIPFTTCVYKGVGANVDSTGMWDNIVIRAPINYAIFMGNEPTIGSFGSEVANSAISPDNIGDDLTKLLYSKPSSWNNGLPGYFTTRKPGAYDVPTRSLPMTNQNTFNLGYDGMDKFIALRLGVNVNCNSDYDFNINSIKFKTEQ